MLMSSFIERNVMICAGGSRSLIITSDNNFTTCVLHCVPARVPIICTCKLYALAIYKSNFERFTTIPSAVFSQTCCTKEPFQLTHSTAAPRVFFNAINTTHTNRKNARDGLGYKWLGGMLRDIKTHTRFARFARKIISNFITN